MDKKNIFLKDKNGWQIEIDLNGGRIVELKHRKRVILGTFDRIDGKFGNTHICVPNFGNEGVAEYLLPFHGPARSGMWKIKKLSRKSMIIYFEFEEIGNYLGKIYVEQEFVLENGLKHFVRVENRGDIEVPVNIAIHNYWNVPEGWNDLKINGKDVTNLVKADDYMEIENKNEISFSEFDNLTLEQQGFSFARLWTGRREIKKGIVEYDKNYVCIEPVIGRDQYFGSEESILKAGKTREVWQKIYF